MDSSIKMTNSITICIFFKKMTERTKYNLLKRVYFDLSSPAAYSGAEKVFLEARKRNAKITRKDVLDFLHTTPTYTIYRPAQRKFKRLATIASGLHSDWQVDLAIFDSLRKNNDGNKYLLVAVDVLSRKMFTAPAYSKSQKHMIPAFDELFRKSGVKPHKIYSDRGLEFQSRAMLEYFKQNGILKHVVYSDDIHASIVERANRTIKDRLYRYFHQSNTHRWVDVVDKIVNSINNTPNRTTGIEPNKVTFKNAEELKRRMYGENPYEAAEAVKPKYKVGDIVRISKAKGKFDKGYHPKYTLEKFKIKEVYRTDPPHYKIEDLKNPPEKILGVIYEPEISLVRAHVGEGSKKIKPAIWEKL